MSRPTDLAAFAGMSACAIVSGTASVGLGASALLFKSPALGAPAVMLGALACLFAYRAWQSGR